MVHFLVTSPNWRQVTKRQRLYSSYIDRTPSPDLWFSRLNTSLLNKIIKMIWGFWNNPSDFTWISGWYFQLSTDPDVPSSPGIQHVKNKVCYFHQPKLGWLSSLHSNILQRYHYFYRHLEIIFEFPFGEIIEFLYKTCHKISNFYLLFQGLSSRPHC